MHIELPPCPPAQNWNLTWDRCVVEPTCGDLPDPDPASGLRRKDSLTDMVKMGNTVAYECINRTLYHVRLIQTDKSGWR